ncbi:hypothetical protein [Dongia sedimenti]|uniref:DUF2384 domain-containing protein n=1 Tax=Dongia sedimenti TaxID=3064282 RepID=A0ABU0YU67_9PROT|nr:DUF2384 domain-containing protein [Rhodospirillaceae bacterium R-7]
MWHVALKVFGTAAKAEHFILAPHSVLHMSSPFELASNSDAGLQEAVELLDRMIFGTAP